MKLSRFFIDAIILLKRNPKLFLPKIVLAFLYGAIMILTAQFLMIVAPQLYSWEISDPAWLIMYDLTLLILLFLVFFLDIFTNSMYPVMIRQFFRKNPVSLSKASRAVAPNILNIFLSVLILVILLAVPLTALSLIAFLSNNIFVILVLAAFALLVSLALTIVFYFFYPVAVLDSVFFFKTFRRSWQMSKGKISKLLVPSLLPFFISISSFALAFFADDLAMLLLFILLRFLIALVQTYHMVLNPSIFLRYKEL